VFAAFCCLCAVHCMQAAAASFVSPKAVFRACTIGSGTAKNSAQNVPEVNILDLKSKLPLRVCKSWIRQWFLSLQVFRPLTFNLYL